MSSLEDKDQKEIIFQMLLEHERMLKQVNYELSQLKEEFKRLESLREKISHWISLSDKLSRIEKWNRKNLAENL